MALAQLVASVLVFVCVIGLNVRIADLRTEVSERDTRITNLRAHVEHEHAIVYAYGEQVDHLRSVVASEHAHSAILAARVASLTAENKRLKAPAPNPTAKRTRIVTKRYTGSIPSLIRSMAASRYSSADVEALVTLCYRESSFKPSARNGSCKGLFQIKTRNPRWADPKWNINAAFAYIARRYHGSPRAALAHSYSDGWF